MRGWILLTLIWAGLAPVIRAQIPLATAVVSVVDGKSVLTIQNNTAVALTAYYWEVKNSGPDHLAGELYFADAAVIRTSRSAPILPHQQKTWDFPVATMNLSAFVAVWADGSSFGDGSFVERIRDRNRVFRYHLTTVAKMVRQSLASGAPISIIVEAVQAAKGKSLGGSGRHLNGQFNL